MGSNCMCRGFVRGTLDRDSDAEGTPQSDNDGGDHCSMGLSSGPGIMVVTWPKRLLGCDRHSCTSTSDPVMLTFA